MRLVVIPLVVVLGLALLFVWAFDDSVAVDEAAERSPVLPDATDARADEGVDRAPPSTAADAPEARERAEEEPGEEPGERPAAGGRAEEEDPLAALEGLSTEPLTFSELQIAGVPERFKGGVRVSKVHPDSSAAEVALEPGDIIVRAQTTMVESLDDLQSVVEGRDYTRLMFVRNGQVLQVVLKPPFRP